jgi:hypothetical protein
LYVDRDLVQAAIAAPNDRVLGDRRDSLLQTQDRRPRPVDRVPDTVAYESARATDDLTVTVVWAPIAARRVSRFLVTAENRGAAAAWLDIQYVTTYFDRHRTPVARRAGVIKQILQPGETRNWDDVTDGMVPEAAATAQFEVTGAEKCIPARPFRSISSRDTRTRATRGRAG